MTKVPPSFDLYHGDLIKSCTDMDAEAFGVYVRLLLYQFEHGSIPKDPKILARIGGIDPEAFAKHLLGICLRFASRKTDDGQEVYVHERMDLTRRTAIERWERNKIIAQKRKNAGKKGGETRLSKTEANAKQVLKQNSSKSRRGKGKDILNNKEEDELGRLPDALRSVVGEWLVYKREQFRFKYGPTGLSQLMTRVLNVAKERSDAEVEQAFRRAMACGWKGWEVWDNAGGGRKPKTLPDVW